jgi:hypothetical protein
MNLSESAFYAKTVTFTPADVAKIDVPVLSERVREIIAESGVESLQVLLAPDMEAMIPQIIVDYWTKK